MKRDQTCRRGEKAIKNEDGGEIIAFEAATGVPEITESDDQGTKKEKTEESFPVMRE